MTMRAVAVLPRDLLAFFVLCKAVCLVCVVALVLAS